MLFRDIKKCGSEKKNVCAHTPLFSLLFRLLQLVSHFLEFERTKSFEGKTNKCEKQVEKGIDHEFGHLWAGARVCLASKETKWRFLCLIFFSPCFFFFPKRRNVVILWARVPSVFPHSSPVRFETFLLPFLFSTLVFVPKLFIVTNSYVDREIFLWGRLDVVKNAPGSCSLRETLRDKKPWKYVSERVPRLFLGKEKMRSGLGDKDS